MNSRTGKQRHDCVASAALAGAGIVQLPARRGREELDQDRLVRLLAEWTLPREIIHVALPSRRGLLPSVRTLINYLAQRFAALDKE